MVAIIGGIMEYNKYVKQAQQSLVNAGYSVGKHGIDGKFGKDTLAAVNEAIADAKEGEDPEDEFPYTRDLSKGDKGQKVEQLQEMLDRWHMRYYLGKGYIDGKFGSGTKEAVKEFQKGMSLDATGKVNKNLWLLLNSESVDISKWITPQVSNVPGDNGKLPFACNCNGKYCDSAGNAIAGKTSVGLMILLVRIQDKINANYNRTDIVIRLTDDINLADHDDYNGGNRCTKWNKLHSGIKYSQHIKCKAADIFFNCPYLAGKASPTMHELWKVCDKINPYGGVGEYPYTIHVDTRGSKARWSDGV